MNVSSTEFLRRLASEDAYIVMIGDKYWSKSKVDSTPTRTSRASVLR
jgi:hypothetical protein